MAKAISITTRLFSDRTCCRPATRELALSFRSFCGSPREPRRAGHSPVSRPVESVRVIAIQGAIRGDEGMARCGVAWGMGGMADGPGVSPAEPSQELAGVIGVEMRQSPSLFAHRKRGE